MLDMKKYTFYVTKNKVIAVSTYAGKTVKGYAKCDPRDEFDLETGKKLAAARCAERIARKRKNRATNKLAHATIQLLEAERHRDKMLRYCKDATDAYTKAMLDRFEIEESL